MKRTIKNRRLARLAAGKKNLTLPANTKQKRSVLDLMHEHGFAEMPAWMQRENIDRLAHK